MSDDPDQLEFWPPEPKDAKNLICIEADQHKKLLSTINKLQQKLRAARELYDICSSTTNKLIEQRNEARKEVCLLRNNENPEEYANLRNWDFHNTTDSDAYVGAAQAIVESEEFMWLMMGSEHTDAHLRALRPAYTLWQKLGGRCVVGKQSYES